MQYEVWIKGRKAATIQILEVPPYRDGSSPTMLKIKGVACKSSYFTWDDYKLIEYRRIPTKENP